MIWIKSEIFQLSRLFKQCHAAFQKTWMKGVPMREFDSMNIRTPAAGPSMPAFKTAAVAIALAMAAAPRPGHAAIIGFLGNFDAVNDTGSVAHGFEIELEGLHSSDVSDTFGGPGRPFQSGRGFDPSAAVQRYGAPEITEYSNGSVFGTRVTYRGLFDVTNSRWDFGTPSIDPLNNVFVTPGDNCWTGGGTGYGAATPCDHFGVGTTKNATRTTYSWLLETSPSSPDLTKGGVTLPAPVIDVIPAANPQNPPEVGAVVVGPVNEQDPLQFGEAIWVKVYTTELEDPPELDDLVADNPIIENAVTEIEWQLVQYDPGNPDSPPSILESGYGAPVGPNAASIVRRYEFFSFSGDYKQEDHEAILAFGDSLPNCVDDPNCDFDPDFPIELGHYLGAQNVAANLAPIPIPAAVWLFGSALGGFGFMRRRSV